MNNTFWTVGAAINGTVFGACIGVAMMLDAMDKPVSGLITGAAVVQVFAFCVCLYNVKEIA